MAIVYAFQKDTPSKMKTGLLAMAGMSGAAFVIILGLMLMARRGGKRHSAVIEGVEEGISSV